MAIVHQAYLFDIEACIRATAPHVWALLRDPGYYDELRTTALAVCDTSTTAAWLLEEHGGWNKDAAAAEHPPGEVRSPEDVGFWLMVLVYSKLSGTIGGFSSQFRAFEQALLRAGWNKLQTDLLIRGRPFECLFELARSKYSELAHSGREIMKHVRPEAQDGRAGWIDRPDIETLLAHLKQTTLSAEAREMSGLRDSAVSLLTVALGKKLAVCWIISG